jgi:hypothetical protein
VDAILHGSPPEDRTVHQAALRSPHAH